MSFTRQLASVVAVALFSSAQAGFVIHVDVGNCPGPGDGSELDPYCSIQTAIDNAADTDEIIVAPGTYTEQINLLGQAITLRSSDGALVTVIYGQGSGPVVSCTTGEGADTIVDGFTVTGGNAPIGAGMLIDGSSPVVRNCRFVDNTASDRGAGMTVQDSSTPTIIDCMFIGNTAGVAAGILNRNFSDLTVSGCTFVSNTSFVGSGINNQQFCILSVTDCAFIDGGIPAAGGGGGVFTLGGLAVLDRCIFSGNHGGASLESGFGILRLTNSIFTGNTGAFGAVVDSNNESLIANCLFAGNVGSSVGGGGVYTGTDGESLSMINCTFVGNEPTGLTTQFDDSAPLVHNCIFRENSPYQITAFPLGDPSQASVFYSDVEDGFFGSGSNNIDANPEFVGGTIGTWTDQAVFDPATQLTTFFDTSALFASGGLVGNLLAPLVGLGELFVIVDNTPTTMSILSNVEFFGFPGGEYRIDDFRLSAESPCIDAADNTAVPEDIKTDLDGNPRFLEIPETPDTGNGTLPIVDMGAYESLGGGCLALTGQEIICHADGSTFTVNVEGLNACTGGTSMFTFTGSGGAVGQELCFTVLVNDGGFCCSTEICVTVPDCSGAEDLVCPGDLDGDNTVDIGDFLIVLGSWGGPDGDVNGDGTTDIIDFLIVVGNWGPCE